MPQLGHSPAYRLLSITDRSQSITGTERMEPGPYSYVMTDPLTYTLLPYDPRRHIQAIMTIYDSHHQPPTLPRQSIFHYLFPSDPSTSAYPVPPNNIPAFIDGLTGESLTRQDVQDQAELLHGGLYALGLKRGDVVALFGTNCLEWLNAIFGSQCAGLRVSPVNYA
jgi:hypothetical protein